MLKGRSKQEAQKEVDCEDRDKTSTRQRRQHQSRNADCDHEPFQRNRVDRSAGKIGSPLPFSQGTGPSHTEKSTFAATERRK